MRLLSACVRHYRVHREIRIEFTTDRTVIAGPNESGKSTFAEALHRALFVPATVTGNLREAMLSHLPGAPQAPEVELEFHHAGQRIWLFKRFGGNRGVQELRIGNRTCRGEEVNEQLAQLLRSSAEGRVTANKVDAQWAHLFIRQDESASDPFLAVGTEQARLQQALRRRAGAEMLVSPRDARALEWLRARWAESMTPTGQIRAGSALAQAIAAEKVALVALEAAQQVVGKVEQHARNIERWEAEMERCAQMLRDSEPFLAERQQRLDHLTQLSQQREAIQVRAADLSLQREQFAAVQQRLHELATLADAHHRQQASVAHQLQQAGAALGQRNSELLTLRSQQQDRRKSIEQVRSHGERLLQAERTCQALGQQQQRWQQLLDGLDQAERELAALAAAASARQHKQQQLHDGLAAASADLEAQQQRLDGTRAARQRSQQELHRLSTLHDDWQAVLEREEARATAVAAQRAAERLQGMRTEIARLQQELQRTQAPDSQQLAALDELARAEAAARAGIAAMATRIQVEAGSALVQLGDETLALGATVTLLEPALLQVGDVRIRLFPGGGRGVAEAGQQLASLEAELRTKLAKAGVTTLAEAHERHALRAELSKDLERHRRLLDAEQPAALDRDFAVAQDNLLRATAQVTALLASAHPMAELLATADAATAQQGRAHTQLQLATAKQALQDLEADDLRAETAVGCARTAMMRLQADLTLLGNDEHRAQGEQKVLEQTHGDANQRAAHRREWLQQLADARAAMQQQWSLAGCTDDQSLRHACVAAQQSLQQAAAELDELEAASNRCHAAMLAAQQTHDHWHAELAALDLAVERERGERLALERQHGDSLARAQREAALAQTSEACAAELAAIDTAFGGDTLDALRLAIAGLRRDEAANRDRIQSLKAECAHSLGALQSTAQNQDPYAELALRQAELQQARALLAERKDDLDALGDVIQRLEAQARRIVQHYAAEFDRVVHKYLAAVFGQRAQVAVLLSDKGDSFAPIGSMQVDRQGFLPEPFAVLSRGAQEQVAVAIRLAAAEVLAKEGDGHLPILLDDSFVHSDASRMLGLRAMIETAAAAGLQVIVFTCDERAYGSADVRLTREPVARERFADATSRAPVAEEVTGAMPDEAIDAWVPESRPASVSADPAEVTLGNLVRALEQRGGVASNPALQQALGWSDSDYHRIKEELVASGRALKGQGRGGTLRLVAMT